MNTNTQNTPQVWYLGQTDTTARPCRPDNDRPGDGLVLVGDLVAFLMPADRTEQVTDELVALHATAAATVARSPYVQVEKWTNAPYLYQRKLWTVRVHGSRVGEYKTKAEGLRAAAVALAIHEHRALTDARRTAAEKVAALFDRIPLPTYAETVAADNEGVAL
jgi:hypothetical protein